MMIKMPRMGLLGEAFTRGTAAIDDNQARLVRTRRIRITLSFQAPARGHSFCGYQPQCYPPGCSQSDGMTVGAHSGSGTSHSGFVTVLKSPGTAVASRCKSSAEQESRRFALHVLGRFPNRSLRAAEACGKQVGRPKRIFRRDKAARLRAEGKSWYSSRDSFTISSRSSFANAAKMCRRNRAIGLLSSVSMFWVMAMKRTPSETSSWMLLMEAATLRPHLSNFQTSTASIRRMRASFQQLVKLGPQMLGTENGDFAKSKAYSRAACDCRR